MAMNIEWPHVLVVNVSIIWLQRINNFEEFKLTNFKYIEKHFKIL